MISIIVPIHNASNTIERCKRSIFSQGFNGVQYIFVEDECGYGPSWARNKGLEQVEGEYIVFVDADDYLLPGALETFWKYRTWDMVIMGMGNFTMFKQNYINLWLREPSKYQALSYVWGKMYNADIIKDNNLRFNEDMTQFEDIEFNMRYIQKCGEVICLPEQVYHYCPSRASIHRFNGCYSYLFKLMETVKATLEDYREDNIEQKIGNSIVTHLITAMVGASRHNRYAWLYLLYEKVMHQCRPFLTHYRRNGRSWIVPVLIRHNMIVTAMVVCRVKAWLRYKGE